MKMSSQREICSLPCAADMVFPSVTSDFGSFRKGYLACLMPIVLPLCPFWTADGQWWYHLSLEWPCFHIAVSPCVPRVSSLSPLPNAFFFKTPLSLLVVSVGQFSSWAIDPQVHSL